MEKHGTVIIVDDNRAALTALQLLLKNRFDKIVTLTTPNQLLAALHSERQASVVLLDMNFTAGISSGNEGLFWLREIKKARPTLPVVLFTAYADIELAVRGIKEGAADFVVKPWDNQKLVDTLLSVCSSRKRGNPVELRQPEMFWGVSEAMTTLRALVEKVAVTDANILITGENGTGKELLAREIHALSGRRSYPFVSVDLGALTESLFESELFGHVKGSFTDAHTDRVGKFEAANDGTLFLDEIGNLPLHLQAKLLTALQSRSIVRIGSNEPRSVNIRLLTATNRRPAEMAAQGLFREDLLYRVNTIHIEIPSLRERKEDILPLAEQFVRRFEKQYDKGTLQLTPEAVQQLMRNPWYGNIRELEHAVEKAVIICENERLSAELFPLPQSPVMTESTIST
ncbi:MAG: sigma-54 dependent transcriptional regulator, partial [Prevotellaceae bacterium]|nr:sigma-54 dependent transcriptional regulator [Prevotellaceae bacterium]